MRLDHPRILYYTDILSLQTNDSWMIHDIEFIRNSESLKISIDVFWYIYMYIYNDSIEISRFRGKFYELSDSIL